MAATATSEEEMELLLSNFDQICEDFKSAISEIQSLKSSYNAEIKKREALEITCNTLKQENELLTRRYTESLDNLTEQLDCCKKYQNLKEKLQRVNHEHLGKEEELKKVIDLLKQDHAAKVRHSEDEIRDLLLDKATKEATINNLRQDLAAHKSHMQTLVKRLDQVQFNMEIKYNLEIQDLKDCLLLEQEEKNGLNKKLQDLEKELLMSTTMMTKENRDLTSVRNVETLKLKIMKLRKDNEILKRKLSSSQEG